MSKPNGQAASAPPIRPPKPEDPVLALTFGLSGIGKTADLGATFCRAAALTTKGGMRPVRKVYGFDIPEVQVSTMEQAIDWMPIAVKKGYSAIIIDDLSLLAKSTERHLDKVFPAVGDGRFKKWGRFAQRIFELRTHARELGVHVGINAHPRPAEPSKGLPRGGPELPSRTQVRELPHAFDIVLRAVRDDRRRPWPAAYTWGDPEWEGKDRFDACPPNGPLCLRQILYHGGVDLPWPFGLEWIGGAVDTVAGKLQELESEMERGEFLSSVMDTLEGKGIHYKHIRWVCRDAQARVELIEYHQRAWREAFSTNVLDAASDNGGLL